MVTAVSFHYSLKRLLNNLYLGYGKCGEDVTRHTTTQVVFDEEKLEKQSRKAFFVCDKEYCNEEGNVSGYEVKMRKRRIEDDKPIHVSLAILQWSKLLFLRFMYFLLDHLRDGSFRQSYCDTDSMCLGLSRSDDYAADCDPETYYRAIFDNLVKPEMRESWEENWKSWFVTTNEVVDQRTPGKLKSKFLLFL